MRFCKLFTIPASSRHYYRAAIHRRQSRAPEPARTLLGLGSCGDDAGMIYPVRVMSMPQQQIKLINLPEYREHYANSVQVRVNVWDFFLVFGTLHQQAPEEVEVRNFEGVYLSPQQAKALLRVLEQNVVQYEQAFGEIKLDPKLVPSGPVH